MFGGGKRKTRGGSALAAGWSGGGKTSSQVRGTRRESRTSRKVTIRRGQNWLKTDNILDLPKGDLILGLKMEPCNQQGTKTGGKKTQLEKDRDLKLIAMRN